MADERNVAGPQDEPVTVLIDGPFDDIDTYVGSRLRDQRKACGLTQTELGNRIGLTFQQIQKYEKGKNRIGAGRLHQLAQILGVSVASFFPEARRAPSIDPSTVFGLNPGEGPSKSEVIELVRCYAKLHDKPTRQSILQIIRLLAKRHRDQNQGH